VHLKNLTLLGFKSFADRTSLDFEPGITAIVGPNGCGKSNVADAIRWVLGEQSAKALRGGEMADVIFSGTDKRKAIGMAEVSLTITDVDEEQLRAAGVSIDYSEVTITRRVFRDGGSEYYINKTASRLRDIQQLFMGTGVGRSSYSIMAQGNITQILSSKPEDRRIIFEEAAGITKFKSQKREALRKLDYTEQNLLRVEDLIKEVKRQIGSLQRQAGKARKFQQFQKELQHLESQLARHDFDTLQAQIGEQKAKADRLRDDMESRSEGVIQTEEEVRLLRIAFAELEQQINQSQQDGLNIKNQIDQNENKVQFNQERLNELESQNARALAEIEEAEQRHLGTEQEIESIRIRLKEAEAALETRTKSVEESQSQVHDIEKTISESQEQLRQAQNAAFASAQALGKSRNEINTLDLLKKGNDTRLEKLSSEKVQLEEERVQLSQTLERFAAGVEEKKHDANRQRLTLEEKQVRLASLLSELQDLTKRLDELLQKQAEKRSRLSVLQQLDAKREGFSEGALAALRQSDSVIGSLADYVRVPDDHVIAIEAALGHHLQLVMTQSEKDTTNIIKELGNGKASIAPVEFLTSSKNSSQSQLPEIPTGTCLASSVITSKPEVEPFIRSLLGTTLIVSDLSQASALWRESKGNFDFVTTSGDLLTRHGVFTGGATGGDHKSTSILGRKNEIRELEQSTQQLQESVDTLSREKGALVNEQNVLQTNLQEAQSDLKATEVAIATHEGEFAALKNSSVVLDQKVDAVVYEVQSLASQQEEGQAKRDELAAHISKLETEASETEQRVQHLNEQLETARTDRDVANSVLTERKVALAAEREALTALNRQKGPLEQRLGELSQLITQRRSETESVLSRKGQSESEIALGQQEVEALSHQRAVNNEKTGELLQHKKGQESQITERDENLRRLRFQLEADQKQKNELDVDLAQKALKAENICQRIEDKYQIPLQDVRSEVIRLSKNEEGQIKVETDEEDQEDSSHAGIATDWNDVAKHVRTLQQKVDAIGPVNLVAIEEYEETEQRFQFLTGQHDDLVKAKDELHEVLNRINTQTREMFVATFTKIQENFRNMFQEMFGGGSADLLLGDQGDVLESGIDIVARPPGKRLQNISLLSGGEQTMTAVALLFSIYQVKPSPFCVLDELDAPLDESNINRFLKVLQRFLEFSQFIIITHNKRTISTADLLYGVTMQERGVSRLVSVKFHRDGEDSSDPKPEKESKAKPEAEEPPQEVVESVKTE
jgi:chromosome segregation protein